MLTHNRCTGIIVSDRGPSVGSVVVGGGGPSSSSVVVLETLGVLVSDIWVQGRRRLLGQCGCRDQHHEQMQRHPNIEHRNIEDCLPNIM